MLFTQFFFKNHKSKIGLESGKRIYNSGKWYEQLNSNLSQSKHAQETSSHKCVREFYR